MEGNAPTVTLTGSDTIEIGRSEIYTIQMVLEYPMVSINVDVFSPLNCTDSVSVCGVHITAVGDAYKCIRPFLDKANFISFPNTEGDKWGLERVRLELGNMINVSK